MASATTQVKILVPGNQPMVALLGQRDVFLKLIEVGFRVPHPRPRQRDHRHRSARWTPSGSAQIFEELLALLEQGHELTDSSVGQTIALVKGDGSSRGRSRAAPVRGARRPLLTARGKGIAPKTIGQKRFVDAIRTDTVTFAIGPPGRARPTSRSRPR